MAGEGLADNHLNYAASLDLCYDGQSFTLNVPWRGVAAAERDFSAAHQRRYGHSLTAPLRLINVRLSIVEQARSGLDIRVAERPAVAEPVTDARLSGWPEPVPLWRRQDLAAGQRLKGPGIVVEAVGTSYIAPGWSALVDKYGNLVLRR